MDAAPGQRVRDADLVLAIGGRLGEVPTGGYTLLGGVRRWSTCTDPAEPGRVCSPTLAIVRQLPEFAAAPRDLDPSTRAGRVAERGADVLRGEPPP